MCVNGTSKTLAGLAVFFLIVTLVLGQAWPATAQDQEPIGRFVVDLRGSLVPFERNEEIALTSGFAPSATPGLGIGLDAGAQVYLYRWRAITIGLGARFHVSRADQGPTKPKPTETEQEVEHGPTLRKTFMSVSPQLSLNFGGRDGWSYVSAGLGTSRLRLYALDDEEAARRRSRTFNYGGGARWFVKEHLAFSLDLRFYAAQALQATDTNPRSPRLKTMVLSVGTSFK